MSALTRREWLAGAGALAGAARAAQKRPNILFLMVDEMRWDAMGCEGHPLVRTPNLDRLARQGSRFANCYTVSPVCSPSRASVFTGRYTHVHGVEMNGIPAHPGEIFLPTIRLRPVLDLQQRRAEAGAGLRSVPKAEVRLSGAVPPQARHLSLARRSVGPRCRPVPVPARGL